MLKFRTTLEKKQFTVLLIATILNFGIFGAESILSWFNNSTSMLADSVDSLGDTITYIFAIVSIFVISRTKKRGSAVTMGIVQLFSATIILEEIIRESLTPENIPNYTTIWWFTGISLGVNIICVILLNLYKKHQEGMKLSFIFSEIDIYINLFTIISAIISFYFWPNNKVLDPIGGGIFFIVILITAIRIFKKKI